MTMMVGSVKGESCSASCWCPEPWSERAVEVLSRSEVPERCVWCCASSQPSSAPHTVPSLFGHDTWVYVVGT